ncbi:hypothetical protein [Pseudobacteroides cellulosolvens]|uniref:hypothetical protein n=1 Tax=Pseudobacteroides cellulosolvens TaxID=35825 RepID=UPI00056812D6|nr:hypothetical protein [Pseudobacteroides cellulosolvens]
MSEFGFVTALLCVCEIVVYAASQFLTSATKVEKSLGYYVLKNGIIIQATNFTIVKILKI